MKKSRHPRRTQCYTSQGLPVVDSNTILIAMGNFLPEHGGEAKDRAKVKALEEMIKEENPKLFRFMNDMIGNCRYIKMNQKRGNIQYIKLLCYSLYHALRHQAIENAVNNTVYGDIVKFAEKAITGDKDAGVVSRVIRELFEKRPY